MEKIVIGVCGRKQSGKDEVAIALRQLSFCRIAFADKLKKVCMAVYGMEHDHMYGDLKETQYSLAGKTRARSAYIARKVVSDVYRFPKETRFDQCMDVCMIRWGGKTPREICEIFIQGCLEVFDWPEHDITPRRVLQFVGTDVCRKRIHDNTWIQATMSDIRESRHERWVITDARFINEINAIRSMSQKSGVIRVHRPSLGEQIDYHDSETEWQSVEPDESIVNDSSIENLHCLAVSAAKSIIDR